MKSFVFPPRQCAIPSPTISSPTTQDFFANVRKTYRLLTYFLQIGPLLINKYHAIAYKIEIRWYRTNYFLNKAACVGITHIPNLSYIFLGSALHNKPTDTKKMGNGTSSISQVSLCSLNPLLYFLTLHPCTKGDTRNLCWFTY